MMRITHKSFFVKIFVLPLLIIMAACEQQLSDKTGYDTTIKDRLNNYTDWGIYRGDKKANQYSALKQINTDNVDKLELAWEYNHGKPEGPGIYSNPIIVDELLYFTSPRLHAIALNATTGKVEWRFNPAKYNEGEIFRGRNRGVVYWEDESGKNQRIYNFVKDRVYAIDAKSGTLIEPFGENGFIDLRKNLPVDPEEASIEVTTPGMVYKNYLIITSRVPEGNNTTPGDIRAYNTLTGEFEWIFHTVPQKGEFGYDTWEREEGMSYGGANAWGGVTVDEERGWVFAATGSAAGEFIYGGHRKGRNLFSSTVLALDATTGERQWHYQVIRHDIFDYDLPPAPILATIQKDGKSRDVVVQLTKMGLTYVLDRDTGEPVFPVVDLPVPPSEMPGEEAWSTQPFPVLPPPLTRLQVHKADLTTITPESYDTVLKQFRKFKSGFVFTPASRNGTITMPGHQGGVEWGGGAFDPATDVLYVNANEIPSINKLIPLPPDNMNNETLTTTQRGANIYNANCTSCHGMNKKGNPPLYPPLQNISLSRDSLHTIITQGRGIMPAFSQFSEENIDNLIAYLKSDETNSPELSTSINVNYSDTAKWWGPDSSWVSSTPQYAQEVPFFRDHLGYPAIKPPWGTLNAINLRNGKILWKVPLGEYPGLVEKGIRHTGTKNFGGPVVTAGNLIFIAATMDEKIRAFDKHSGSVLWEYKLPAGGYATPSIYQVNGKQFVVIAAGGGGKPGTKVGDSIIAFALPEKFIK